MISESVMKVPYVSDEMIVSMLPDKSKHDYANEGENSCSMTTYQERLALAMSESDELSTPTKLAERIGCTSQAVSQALSGASKKLGAENHSKAAQELGVSPIWLASGEGLMRSQPKAQIHIGSPDPIIEALAIIEAESPAKAALYRAQILADLEEINRRSGQPIKKGQRSAS